MKNLFFHLILAYFIASAIFGSIMIFQILRETHKQLRPYYYLYINKIYEKK